MRLIVSRWAANHYREGSHNQRGIRLRESFVDYYEVGTASASTGLPQRGFRLMPVTKTSPQGS